MAEFRDDFTFDTHMIQEEGVLGKGTIVRIQKSNIDQIDMFIRGTRQADDQSEQEGEEIEVGVCLSFDPNGELRVDVRSDVARSVQEFSFVLNQQSFRWESKMPLTPNP